MPNTPPIIDRNLVLSLDEGDDAIILSNRLRIEDADKDTITYTLTALPTKGTLKLNGIALDLSSNKTFTQADINNNSLTYTHNGTKTTDDEFFFTATDGNGGNISNTKFVIAINPYNQAPSQINFSNNNVIENSANGTVIADLSTLDRNKEDTHSYQLLDNVGGRFVIEGNKLKVANGSLLNFEQTQSYQISIQSTDNGNPAKSTPWTPFTINVTDVNEAPTLGDPIPKLTLDAGSPFTYKVPTETFKDPDGEKLNYTATLENGDPLPSWLIFDPTTGTFSGTPKNANAGDIKLKVTATDKEGASVGAPLNVTVNFVNSAPTEITLSNSRVAENSAIGTVIANLSATDEEATDTHTYTLLDDAQGRFKIEGNQLKVANGSSLDFETAETHTIRVKATDNGGKSVEKYLEIGVTNVNEAPTAAIPLSNQIIDAKSAFNYQFSANTFKDVDADDTLTYKATLANGQPLPSWLTFNAATRTFSGTPTNGDAGEINLKVTATDKGGLSVNTGFNLTVNSVNKAPDDITLSNSSVAENSANGTIIANLSATDPDTSDTHTYALVNNAGGRFVIEGNQLKVANSSLLDFESATSHSIRVKTTDKYGLSFEKDLIIGVTNVNEAPTASVISNQTFNAQSAFSFTTNTFSDVDAGDTLTYSATLANGQPLPSWLTFNPNTRTFSGTPTNGNAGILNLKVTATDKGNLSASTQFNLTVNAVNNPPTNITLSNSSVAENSANGLVIANLSATDADANDTHTYALVNNAGGRFVIEGNQLKVANGSLLNFESATSHSIRVKTTDKGGLSVEKDLIIGVTNVNEAPIASAISNQIINAQSAFSYQFTANTFTDVDAGDTLTYSATLANGQPLPSWLTFNPNTRTFSGTPTNGNAGILNLKVTATDRGGLSVSNGFNLTVNSVNNPPVVTQRIASQNPSLNTRGASFTFVSNTFTDPDPGDSLTYSATAVSGQWRSNAGGWNSLNSGSLPSWLTFNPTTRTFTTTGSSPDWFTLNVQVQARDRAGAVAFDTFQLGGRSGAQNVVINNNSTVVISNNVIINNTVANIVNNQAISNVIGSTINVNFNNVINNNVINNTIVNTTAINNAINVGFSNNWWRPAPLIRPVTLFGFGSDNYIAGGAVFFDANKNGVLEANEPFSITSEKGDFSLDIDLEAFDKNKNGFLDASEGRILVTGGTDVATGLTLETPLTAAPDTINVTILSSVVASLVDEGLTQNEAQAKLKAALSLPTDVDLATFDPILATEENRSGGAKVFSEMIKAQSTVTQIASLLDGASAASMSELTAAAVGAIASHIQTGTPLDLTAKATLDALIRDTVTKAQTIDPNLGDKTVLNVAQKAAEIIAQSNQSIDEAVANHTGNDITAAVARTQIITLGEIPKDLFEVTAGIKTITQGVSENTDAALDAQIVAIKQGGQTLTGTAATDTLNGGAGADSINGGTGADILRGDESFDSLTGGGGKDTFVIRAGDGTDTITDFGGVGKGTRPTSAVLAEVDTLKFEGAGLTAENLLTYQKGADLVLTFDSVNSPRVVLKNMTLENLDNLLKSTGSSADVGNILFDGETQIKDNFDVIDANQQIGKFSVRNKVRSLNDLNNNNVGVENSNDVFNGMGGNDTLTGLSGNDILRGGDGDDLLNGGVGKDTLMGGSGRDRFILAAGKGSDVISDFGDGIDTLLLTGGLTFQQLSITASAGATNISIASSGELLASLNGIDTNSIGVNDFALI